MVEDEKEKENKENEPLTEGDKEVEATNEGSTNETVNSPVGESNNNTKKGKGTNPKPIYKDKEVVDVKIKPQSNLKNKRKLEQYFVIGVFILLVGFIYLLVFDFTPVNLKNESDGYTNDKPYKEGKYPAVEVKDGDIESYSANIRELLKMNTKNFEDVDYINIAFQSDLEYLIEGISSNFFMDYSLMKDKKCTVVKDCGVYVDEDRELLIEQTQADLKEVFAYIDPKTEYSKSGENEALNDYKAESLERKGRIVKKFNEYVASLDYTNNTDTIENFLYKASVGKGDILTELEGFATMVKSRVTPQKQ